MPSGERSPSSSSRRPVVLAAIAAALVIGGGAFSLGSSLLGAGRTPEHRVVLHVTAKGGSAVKGCPAAHPCTLTAALAQAKISPHTVTVNVAAGTYQDTTLIVNGNYDIEGAGASSTILQGPGTDPSNSNPDIVVQSGTVTIAGMTVQGGSGGGNEKQGAGGIDNAGNLTLDNVVVTDNLDRGSTDGAGGIANTGTLTLENSTVDNNTGADDLTCAGGIANDGTMTIENSTVSNNTCNGPYGYGAGGITNAGYYIGSSDKAEPLISLTIDQSTISGNSATTNGCGRCYQVNMSGGLLNAGTASVSNSTFSSDTALGSGGAILNAGSLTVSNGGFSGNTASHGGGAIAQLAQSANTAMTISGSTFSSNSATFGGAIDTSDGSNDGAPNLGSATVTNSAFSSNSASVNGGAIDNADASGTGSLTVTNSSFSSDSAGGFGGGIDNGDDSGTGTATVTGSTFNGESANQMGGAIDNGSNSGTGALTVADSTFEGNASPYGAAIENGAGGGTGYLAATSSTFDTNNASTGGMSIDTSGGGTAGVAGDIFGGQNIGVECSGTLTDYGYNVSDDPSCNLGPDSVNNSSVIDSYLGTLANNGGPTKTIALLASASPPTTSPDPAAGAIPASGADTYTLVATTSSVTQTTTSICSVPDQRGIYAATPCAMGSYQINALAPTITGISPTSGPISGGTSITITGSGFYGTASVKIAQGGSSRLSATHVHIVSWNEITAVTAGHALPGTFYVYVSNSGATSKATSAGRFTYIAPRPVVAAIYPRSGPLSGGTKVTIFGKYFYAPAKVKVGKGGGVTTAISAKDVKVLSTGKITAVMPRGAGAQGWNVFVITPGGASKISSGDVFTYKK